MRSFTRLVDDPSDQGQHYTDAELHGLVEELLGRTRSHPAVPEQAAGGAVAPAHDAGGDLAPAPRAVDAEMGGVLQATAAPAHTEPAEPGERSTAEGEPPAGAPSGAGAEMELESRGPPGLAGDQEPRPPPTALTALGQSLRPPLLPPRRPLTRPRPAAQPQARLLRLCLRRQGPSGWDAMSRAAVAAPRASAGGRAAAATSGSSATASGRPPLQHVRAGRPRSRRGSMAAARPCVHRRG
eukprot:4738132-Alexandrium_andersonii.AAC.1